AMEYFEYWATINKSLPIKLTLARNTPYFHILNRLVNDKDTNVLRAIARNVNCPNSILEKLSIHENRSVRGNVATNPNCSEKLLEKLSNDPEWYVRSYVSENVNCP